MLRFLDIWVVKHYYYCFKSNHHHSSPLHSNKPFTMTNQKDPTASLVHTSRAVVPWAMRYSSLQQIVTVWERGCRVQTVINIRQRGRGGGGRRWWWHNAPCKFKEILKRRGKKSQPALKVATPTSYAASGYNKTYTELELESSAFQTEMIKKYVYHTYVWSPYIYDLLKWHPGSSQVERAMI